MIILLIFAPDFSIHKKWQLIDMRLQRIPIDGGFTCPNRDGTKGIGGCTFCNSDAFAPSYCRTHQSITEQIEAGKRFFAEKYRGEVKYLAYFQSFSGTYAPVETLRQRYEEALSAEDVVGLVIATRPDCTNEEVLELLSEINQHHAVTVEYGVESCYDKTLLHVNRGHDFACTEQAIRLTAARGIAVGVHLIIGLPGETEDEILQEADILSALPITSLKLHQLQIMQGTPMATEWQQHPERFLSLTAEAYAELIARFVKRLRPDIHLERFAASAPSHMVLAPRWGLKPQRVQEMIDKLIQNLCYPKR